MTCSDCVAKGFSCGRCESFGFDCAVACDGNMPRQAVKARAETCSWRDPRSEGTYVAAVTGPKDVIIVMDMSNSMTGAVSGGTMTRFDLTRLAVKTVLATLTVDDFVQIVIFGAGGNRDKEKEW